MGAFLINKGDGGGILLEGLNCAGGFVIGDTLEIDLLEVFIMSV